MRASASNSSYAAPDAEARLAFAEFLLGCDEPRACAKVALDWLARHAGIDQAVCAMAEADPRRLVSVATHGLPALRAGGFLLDLEDEGAPLVHALTGSGPVYFPRGPRQPRTPLQGTAFHAVPLGEGPSTEPAPGLLLVSAHRARLDPTVGWLAARLGAKLARLRSGTAHGERQLRRERSLLYSIINAVADPIIVTGPAGDFVMMNDPARKLLAAGAGASFEARERVRANNTHFSTFVASLLFSGSALRWRGEINLVEPGTGATVPVEVVSGKVVSEQGELTTVVTILHDRSEALDRARLYEQLKRASDELELKVHSATAELAQQNEKLRRQAIQLEQASSAKSQFLANMSHELRTPLNAILGYTHMLLQGVSGELSASQRRSLTRIASNGRHLLEVISEILDITRIEAGRMPLNLSEFHLREVLDEVQVELDAIIVRSNLSVTTVVPPRLPKVLSDRQKVKQIVVNLLSNALKFTHQGSVRVTAAYAPARRRMEISVADTGIGIDASDQEKIFEDFQQVDSSPTRAYGGTGLGLSICRRLAGMIGGRLTVQSKRGEGSTFTLRFPCRVRQP